MSIPRLNRFFRQANDYWLRTRNTVRWMAQGFQPIQGVMGATYIQVAPDLRIEQADPGSVKTAACALEATLVMSEGVPETQLLSIELSHLELASFVCYMRQLDREYRVLLAENERLSKFVPLS